METAVIGTKILSLRPHSGESADFGAARRAGFDSLLIQIQGNDVASTAKRAAAADMKLLLDVGLDRFPIDHPLVQSHPEAFSLRRQATGNGPIDPRNPAPAIGEARARLKSSHARDTLFPAVVARLQSLVELGAAGFRIRHPDAAEPEMLRALIAELKGRSDLLVMGDMRGVSRETALAMAGAGLDGVTGSVSYWDMHAPWLADEYEALRMVAPVQAEISPEALQRCARPAEIERLLMLAAGTASGMIVPAEALERTPRAALERAMSLCDAAARFAGEMRMIPLSGVTALLRADAPDMRVAEEAMLLLVNPSGSQPALPRKADVLAAAGASFQPFRRQRGTLPAFGPLGEAEVRPLFARRAKAVGGGSPSSARAAAEAASRPRLVIEAITPTVDGGAFPVKRCVGEVVSVEADIFADGHEQLAAELRWRAIDEKKWQCARLEPLGNDRWRASFPLERIGRHEYVVEAWLDRYGGFTRDFRKKLEAGVAQPVDHQEGRLLIENAAKRIKNDLRLRLEAFLSRFDNAPDAQSAAAILLDPELGLAMDEADERPFAIASAPMLVESDRLAARFSSWYELFPRSQTDDPKRHGTFDDVIQRLPAIRAMGFDTLYFPPIHPIGRAHRKGPNNSLEAGPDDPGSPYAIGSPDGGHDAVHPELGTLDEFRRLVAAAHDHGLEIALDFAIQCSPDHPWLREHPGWFDWRPDGTIKYAENPPKKYQDIVNVDFYKKDAIPGLWLALRDVVLFWCDQGVKSFRVDNPHTKALAFWEWMIADVRRAHPDAIFLSEAFTRPKLMYRLAKIGFSQSYTYFTWRNEKQELTDYLTELSTEAPKEFFRPHFFVNTPDINPTFLQTSGRAGFVIRAVLAATLSGLFGVYSGFELCEAQAVPGKEEYWDSEKYIVKPRDWQAPGNIIAEITLLNRLRRAYPALQTHMGVTFYKAGNDNILYYGKRSPDGAEMILVAVSLDPHNPQAADFEAPLWEWGIDDDGSLEVEDLVGGQRFEWRGKMQHVRLDPDRPFAIWRAGPTGGTA